MTAYRTAESGPALLLIHGHPFDHTMWTPQTSHFSSLGWRVVAPDLRGYGVSPIEVGDRTLLETFAGDLVRQLGESGANGAVVVGLSMGGQIALEVLRLFPHVVRGLVLADTSPRAETDDGRRARAAAAARMLCEGMAGYAADMLPKMVSRTTIEQRPDVAAHVLAMMQGTSPRGAAAACLGRAERPDYVDLLAKIRVPTLVAVGSEDEFTPVTEARFIQEHVPGARLAIFGGAGHLPNLECAAEFNDVVESFLREATLAPYLPAAASGPGRASGSA